MWEIQKGHVVSVRKQERGTGLLQYIMGIPQAIGAAGELSWRAVPHSDIRIAFMQTHTYGSAGNTKRITMVAKISAKHVPHSGTF